MSIVKTALVFASLAFFFALGAREMHVQEKPCHDFAAQAIVTYPPIESPIQNNVAGARKGM